MSVTVQDLRAWKSEGRRFAMLTAWDYPVARFLDQAAVPVILVGDTLAENVLGFSTTLPVTMDAMVHHCQAVARGATNALIVGDLPFLSYQVSVEEGVRNAGRYLNRLGIRDKGSTAALEGVQRRAKRAAQRGGRACRAELKCVGTRGAHTQALTS